MGVCPASTAGDRRLLRIGHGGAYEAKATPRQQLPLGDRVVCSSDPAGDMSQLTGMPVVANLAGWMLARACGSEVQAVAVAGSWVNDPVRDRARVASSHLDLSLLPGLGSLPGLGFTLGLSFDPSGVFAAGLPLGLLCREALRGLVGACEQLV